jgi:O-antigen/teichoic acid export membrane protein
MTTFVVSWYVPQLFHQMPAYLINPLRVGILVVGLAACFALPFNAFLAVFVGLQRYGFPAAVAIVSKVISSIALITFLLLHATLAQLAWLLAISNVMTALAQFAGWKRYARGRVDFSLRLISARSIMSLAQYGAVVSIWTLAMLLISGTDLFIVGHFDYGNTGYYGIASNATNFLLLLITSLFSPLLPAVSGMLSTRTPRQIGEITIRMTRYCVITICILALPLLIGGYPLLRIWVGSNYATRCVVFLNILVLGNAVRMIFYPYTVVVVATHTQHLATISAVVEALVNFGLSLYLVHRIGAAGVAVGTMVGAFVGATLHFTVSMARTRTRIEISRRKFGLEGLLRPMTCTIPSVVAALVFQKSTSLVLNPWSLVAWAVATLALIWWVGLNWEERAVLWDRA